MIKTYNLDGQNNFLDFFYDRNVKFKDTADDLYSHINNFTNGRDLISLYDYFEKAYGLPQSVTKQN